MGKKMGENSKAVEAREKKNEKATKEKNAKDAATEDAKWADDGNGKLNKKEEAERKRLETLARKKERDDLLAEETQANTPKVKPPPEKMTQNQIRQEKLKRMEANAKAAAANKELETHLSAPLQENINRVELEGDTASSVTEAIAVLAVAGEEAADKHPEKRMKAAYLEFEERRLPELKEENKSLKLSQLKQMIFKEWQKHPDNPHNKQ